ncbi:hypothetical protein [Niabella beijingensis]|uniref:hypothetical protein n=1 Tax=Niabella beijingensis TaxID=2872700 RepID=UPI001CBD6CF5|nr:hypothetical protein [Niabella beijingensis]MBZ4189192.1 hypothetical protein [Niabella beijingensis]
MNNTKQFIFLFLPLIAFGLYSCKDKRHDLSREYRLDHYAFVLVSAINDREFYLRIMRETLQEKNKTIQNPNRADTLKGDRQHLTAYDALFSQSEELLYEPVKKISPDAVADNAPPENFTPQEKAWLNEQTGRLVTVFRQINNAYGRFDQYYENSGYKEDKGVRGRELTDSIRMLDDQFGVISDSIILRSDRIFKDIYRVPEKKNAGDTTAALMEKTMKACNTYILLQEQLLSGKQPGDIPDKELSAAKDSIRQQMGQLVQLGLSGTERSIWADVLVLRFRDLLFGFSTYSEVRLPDPGEKGLLQKTDLDFLKDLENRMRRCYNVFVQL